MSKSNKFLVVKSSLITTNKTLHLDIFSWVASKSFVSFLEFRYYCIVSDINIQYLVTRAILPLTPIMKLPVLHSKLCSVCLSVSHY